MSSLLLVLLFLSFSCHGIEGGRKVSRQLQKSKDIDEYDCVDIYKQPALDNILLKNHKIQDSETGNWWLFIDSDVQIGYWPKEILPHLSKAATFVQYGGWTYNSPDGLSPPMGNGRFPNNNLHKSCFFATLQIVNKDYNLIDIEQGSLQKVIDNTSCYDAKHLGEQYGTLAQTFTFGGPGGMCGT
ncbi:hypothetical protein EZV62_027656 [Acer yangbiense]|uniref:Neprosin PEP catalytic domain-containing protein n=1 Tax=Acer yangbiense TaxID=1000413 RepID=A0A5C7GVH4_9ROSI|nr:hypothetical protein EZV62_027656 [Acer yangbiense]